MASVRRTPGSGFPDEGWAIVLVVLLLASAQEKRQTRGVSLKSIAALLPVATLLVIGSACSKARKPPNSPYPNAWYPPQPVYTPPYTGPVYTNWVIPSATSSTATAPSAVPTTSATPNATPTTSTPPMPTGVATAVIGPTPPSTGPRVPGAEAVIDSASVIGSLKDARPQIEKWQTPFLRCYALGLVNDPAMRGTVQLRLKVGTNGKVTDAWKDAGGTVTYEVAACILERTLAEQFTPPAEPATIQVHVLLNPDHPRN